MLETFSTNRIRSRSGLVARILLSVLGTFLCAGVFAQNVTVKGVVKDAAGEPLTGVSILVEHTSIGTTTDIDGKYELSAPKDATLVFFFLGYETQRVALGNRTALDVSMSETSVGMDEVVVVGYGTQSRRTITSAVTKIDGDLVNGRSVNTVGEALRVKSPEHVSTATTIPLAPTPSSVFAAVRRSTATTTP